MKESKKRVHHSPVTTEFNKWNYFHEKKLNCCLFWWWGDFTNFYFILNFLPTISLSPDGKLLKVFLKSSDLDLYEGYNALYQEVFLALWTPGSSLLLQLKNKKNLKKKCKQIVDFFKFSKSKQTADDTSIPAWRKRYIFS